jgi:hypothetical protein
MRRLRGFTRESVTRKRNWEEKILAAVRIASIVHAIASVVATEKVVSSAQSAVA